MLNLGKKLIFPPSDSYIPNNARPPTARGPPKIPTPKVVAPITVPRFSNLSAFLLDLFIFATSSSPRILSSSSYLVGISLQLLIFLSSILTTFL